MSALALGCGDGGCERSQPSPQHGAGAAEISSLAQSTAPMRAWFEAHQGELRFVALLSPTCPGCQRGAQATRRAVVAPKRKKRWSYAVVWVPMLPADDDAALRTASGKFDDRRVRQFFDPNLHAGLGFARAIAPKLKAPAWDVYLFYADDARWDAGDPPKPRHGLGQYRGPGGKMMVGDGVDANLRPTPVGPSQALERLLGERAEALDSSG